MSVDFMFVTSLLFLGGVVAVPIASRLGLGSVLGYLIAGIALSPILHWAGTDVIELQHFAEFGVVMMLFLVGLEMSPKALWEMRARIFVLGGLQVVVTTGIVAGIAMMLGQPWTVALAIGMVLALSSTAIVNQTLNEKGLLKSDGGHASFSVLLFQDIAVIPMLVFIPLLALPELQALLGADAANDHHSEGLHLSFVDGLNGWQTALVSAITVGVVVAAGHFLTDPVFRFVSRARLRELFVSTALMLVLGIALLMTMVGLSPALGTFLAGVVMASSEFRHELESDIGPFKGIFLGIFFITVGAGMNFALLSENLGPIVGMTAGLIALKALVLLVLARVFRLQGGDKWLFALGLAQAGEFGFVLLSFSVANAVIPVVVSDQMLLVVALSMLVTPLLFVTYDKLIAPRYSKQETREADEIDSTANIIVAGHGRVGGIVNQALNAAGFETTVVDYSADQLDRLRSFGFSVHYGDATRPDLLHAAGIEHAKLLVIAIDDKESTLKIVRHVCQHHPNVHVIARAVDVMHVYELWSAGCRDIIRETYDSALRTGRSALEALGFDRSESERRIKVFEEMDRQRMLELAGLYDIDIPLNENKAFVKRFHELRDEWEREIQEKMTPKAGM
ncbi:MAG: cation:proton antiporter [Pseudomonadota bacterium]